MSCNTGNDGKVSFDVSNFSVDYNYTITKDGAAFVALTTSTATTIPLTGLGFGVYVINVTDNTTGCVANTTVTVKQPIAITYTSVATTNVNCNNTNSTISFVGLTGGTGSLSYAIVLAGTVPNPAFTSYSGNLTFDTHSTSATSWDIYVKDSNNCFIKIPNVAVVPDPLPAGFTATAVSQCPSSTGTYDINITVGTGMGPFEYSIGSGFQPGTSFTVNVPKTYDLIVKDRFGCPTTFPAAVTILAPLSLQNVIVVPPTCADNDGTISASATGGSGNYSFQLDGALPAVVGATANFTGVSYGIHTILVTDTATAPNCTDSVQLDLVRATRITGFALIMTTPVTCNGGTDGTITASMDDSNSRRK